MLVVACSWASPASAQIFATSARTAFFSGFGFRTFVSSTESGDSTPSVSRPFTLPGQTMRVRISPLAVVYGLRRRLSVVAIVPFVDKQLRRREPAGVTRVGAGIGIGDSTVLLRWRLLKRNRGRGSLEVGAEFGVKTPTGSHNLRDRDGTRLPRALQRGSGSWDPTANLDMTFVPAAGRGRWVFGADIGGTLGTRADGFEAGDRIAYDAMVKVRLLPHHYPGHDTFVLLELNGRWRGDSRELGSASESTGGHVIYLSPGIQFLLRQNVVLEAGVQIPIVERIGGAQLPPGVNVLVGLRYIIVP